MSGDRRMERMQSDLEELMKVKIHVVSIQKSIHDLLVPVEYDKDRDRFRGSEN